MNNKGALIWVGGFAGVLLLYAAYRSTNHQLVSPWSLIANAVRSGGGAGHPTTGPTPTGDGSGIGIGNTRVDTPSVSYHDGGGNVVSSGGSYYTQTDNGSIGDELPAVYQHDPHNYIPRTAQNV